MRTTSTAASDHARDLRARIAWAGLQLYRIAPAVGIHPVRLGRLLNGKEPLRPDIAERIERAITEAIRQQ